MFFEQTRRILQHTLPMLIVQIVSLGMAVIDTVLLGHYQTEDLAAMAVGSGIYIPSFMALAGILQAIAPIVAHHRGAGNDDGIAITLLQGLWLALLLSIPGICFLQNPDIMFSISSINPAIEAKARLYTSTLSWGIPGVLIYRTIYVFCNALGHPKPLMFIAIGGTSLHSLLAWLLVTGSYGGVPLGIKGCALSNVIVYGFMMLLCLVYIIKSSRFRPYRLFYRGLNIQISTQKEILFMGIPMGFSNFVEVSSFTMSSIFVAQLGAAVVAGHRITANIAAVGYMLPLSIAIATITQVGSAAGAKDWMRARISALSGITMACIFAVLFSVLVWGFRKPLVAAYTIDDSVRQVIYMLIPYLVLYQFFDAIQTVAAFSLRGYKIAFIPMLVHVFCFWGIGLAGGWYLAFRTSTPLGVSGFWIALLSSLILASILLGGLLYLRTHENRKIKYFF